ncbi:hypothetical protein KEJ37_00090 [Candidatus Bathyarchaeota archaeon]|nr:hypothetical protein [Candidatus Bathyarchaeota archaeon]
MVRIQRRLSRKRYLGGKYAYEYERLSLDIPSRFHKMVKPFTGHDLDIEISVKGSYLIITLSPRKTFLQAENPREKLRVERLTEAGFLHGNANST